MKTIAIKKLIYLALATAITPSCKKFIEIDTPKNQLTAKEIFTDSVDADAAILGNYINMSGSALGLGSGSITLYTGLSSDELYQTGTNLEYTEFYTNLVSPTNSFNTSLWTECYKYIYTVNACIEGLKESTTISQLAKSRLTAEARFIRAFIYFQLVNLYGPVPIVTSTDYNGNRLIGRSSKDLVYNQIVEDLTYSQNNLPDDVINKNRAGYYSATALLAKVYLYVSDFNKAEIEASKVIGSGKYNLMADLDNVFLSTSDETILALLPVYPNRETWEGYFFIPSSSTSKPKYSITNSLISSFGIGDLRQKKWIKVNVNAGQNYPYPNKYKVANSTAAIKSENYVLFRLAEQYLIRAEARARLGKINGIGSAEEDLNIVHKRAGFTDPVSVNSFSDMIDIIEKERKAELFCEWGNRWFDLKRHNKADEVLGPIKANWQSTSVLYPIPLQEISSNPELIQNKGY